MPQTSLIIIIIRSTMTWMQTVERALCRCSPQQLQAGCLYPRPTLMSTSVIGMHVLMLSHDSQRRVFMQLLRTSTVRNMTTTMSKEWTADVERMLSGHRFHRSSRR